MKKTDLIFKNLQRFANDHKLILEDNGECGFGRPCVGFIASGGNWVDYNPTLDPDYKYVWPRDERVCPPNETEDAYHKHDCMAVLVHDDNYDKALRQLNEWVKSLETHGEVYIDTYETGAKGLQVMFSGVVGYAVRIKSV